MLVTSSVGSSTGNVSPSIIYPAFDSLHPVRFMHDKARRTVHVETTMTLMSRWKSVTLPFTSAAFLLGVVATSATAQTDYYNTDAGRPMQIEDAHAVERRAFEIQAAPLRLERSSGGTYHWGIEPELAYGILPRTNIEIGFPYAFLDAGAGERTSGLTGIHLAAFHNLNAETSIPALAVSAAVLLPVGSLAPDEAYTSIKGIMTRTFTWARFHVNGEYTIGSRLDAGDAAGGAAELSSWIGGIAVDRAFPLRSLLVSGEVYAREPIVRDEEMVWTSGIGLRYQLDPRFNIDGGFGRRITGDDQGWYVTFGTAYAFGLPWRP